MERKKAPAELLRAIEQNWKQRVIGGSAQNSARVELEFFAGAMSALSHLGFDIPVTWVMKGLSGRRIVEGTKAQWVAEEINHA